MDLATVVQKVRMSECEERDGRPARIANPEEVLSVQERKDMDLGVFRRWSYWSIHEPG